MTIQEAATRVKQWFRNCQKCNRYENECTTKCLDAYILIDNALQELQKYKDLEKQGPLVPVIHCSDCKHWGTGIA